MSNAQDLYTELANALDGAYDVDADGNLIVHHPVIINLESEQTSNLKEEAWTSTNEKS